MQILRRFISAFLLAGSMSSGLMSQDNNIVMSDLIRKFNTYVKAVPREEIFIHTDREDFIAGETMRMKIYLTDRRTMKPSGLSRIVYIELLNSENRPVLQKKFAMIEGFGNGQLILPDTLSTGNYIFRAYTSWMKNFLPGNCFLQDIRIYNTTRNATRIKTLDLSAMAAMNTTNPPGASTYPDLKTGRLNNNDLEISFSANETLLRRSGNQLLIIVQTHGVINYSGIIQLKNGLNSAVIPAKHLSPGVNQINIFDQVGNHLAEKYCYTAPSDTDIYEIHLNKSVYKTREKVIISLSPVKKNEEGLQSASLSISVIPAVFNNGLPQIGKYLAAGSEFGLNYSLAQTNIDEITLSLNDSIMVTGRSNWIDWTRIRRNRLPDITFPRETEEHYLSGRVVYDDKNQDLRPERMLLCIPGKEPDFQTTLTDKSGKFSFSLHIDEEKKDLIIMPDDAGKKKKIIIDMPFSEKGLPVWKPAGDNEETMIPLNWDWSINQQVRRNYGISDSGDPLKPVILPQRKVRFYGRPDIQLILSDYVALPKMEEVFFELLPRVSLKKRDNYYEVQIADRINDNRYELTPALFLDGVKIHDAGIIAGLDPSDVEEIDVIKDKYVIGSYFLPGLVNVVTKKADFSAIPLPEHMIRFSYKTVDPVLSFVIPDYSNPDMAKSSIPDFRNTLYWNPDLIPLKEGTTVDEFMTSDIPGSYDVVVQGITSEGHAIYKKMTFEVK